MSSMRDVAALAGVSVSTVAAVINDNKYVSPDLKLRIESAMLRSGYKKRDREAEDFAERTVAVILPGIYSSFFPPMLSGMTDVASARRMTIMLFDSNRSVQREAELLKGCRRRGIRNVILDSVCDVRHEQDYFGQMRAECVGKGMNMVVLERKAPQDAFVSIYADNRGAAREVTNHLVACGCRTIAHIGGASVFPHTKVREDAFLSALAEAGVPFDQRLLLRGDFTPISGFSVIRELLDKGIRVDGIFAANDQMAIGAMKALSGSGLRIPKDVAVAGFDNLNVSSLVTPALTTVQYPIYQMGYQAMLALADWLDGREPIRDMKLEHRLIVRGSTVEGSVSDWNLQGW